ncbi:MAG: sel1 repeat family protein [Alphaproteobacteria bacterium]|nr:sel1 repeat family protein [Alphaproteobacteria bacterium]
MNAWLDNSQEQQCEGIVIEKHVSHGRHSTSYHAEIPTCTSGKLPAITLDSYEDISVSREKYDEIVVNQSKGIITYKSGRYNIPWKISGYVETQRKIAAAAPYMQRFSDAARDADYLRGLAYFTGKNQIKNDALAVEAFKLAASRGNALAEHDLAYMYMNGVGAPQDTKMAAQLVWQSAQQGYALAQDYLGVMYGDGINGLPQDWVQSFIWIHRAAAQGYDQAIKDLDYAKSHMTHEQIVQAEQQANQPASSSTIH